MTTSTKRTDGGELLAVSRAAFEWIDAVPSSVVAALPTMPGIDRDWANLVMDRASTPTNESPAPQATKKSYIKPLRTIVEIDARYADQIRDLLNAPAPQPPVEGLREALEHIRSKIGKVEPDKSKDDVLLYLLYDLEKIARAALASPSLTAGEPEIVSSEQMDAIERAAIAGTPPASDMDGCNCAACQAIDEQLGIKPAPATLIEQSDSEKT